MEKTVQNLSFNDRTTQKFLSGIEKIESAVCSTLGPNGNNVLIEKQFGAPQFTKDGVSVIKGITLSDPAENIACQVLKEASSRTADLVGDGTTTTIALASEIFRKSLKYSSLNFNKFNLERSINNAVAKAVELLKENSKTIKNENEVIAVASISANNDQKIGELISQAFEKVGKDGVITVSDSHTAETTLDFSEGMEIDKGYISPYFITDQSKSMCTFSNPFVFVTDKKLTIAMELVPLLEYCAKLNKPLMIIAEDVAGEALSMLVLNKMRGLQLCAIKAPGFGERRREMLIDLCTLLGGELVDETVSSIGDLKPESFKSILGECETINCYKDRTAFINGSASKENIENRISQIKLQIEESNSDYDKEKLRERASKLSGGVAIIKVGAPTEVEQKQKKDRVEDSISATRAAIDEGISLGGGVAFMNISPALKKLAEQSKNEYDRVGYNIIRESIRYPFTLILSHLDEVSKAEVINKIKLSSENVWCYNGLTNSVVKGFEEGIIDPTKVLRVALQNAASVATTLLTTNCVITNEIIGKNESCNCSNEQEM